MIVPPLRKSMLQQLHSGHCGMVCKKEPTRSYFWWPELDGQFENTSKSISSCQKGHNVTQLARLHPWDWSEEAWQQFCRPIREENVSCGCSQ